MPEGYVTLIAGSDVAVVMGKLIKEWEAGGRVGPHPASRQARFERGEPVPPAGSGSVPLFAPLRGAKHG